MNARLTAPRALLARVFDRSVRSATRLLRRRRGPEFGPGARTASGVDHMLVGLEKAVETMQLGVTVTDTNGRILYTNPADARMHGYSVEELIGQDVRVFAPGGAGQPLSTRDLGRRARGRRETVTARNDRSTFSCHPMFHALRHRGRPGRGLGDNR